MDKVTNGTLLEKIAQLSKRRRQLAFLIFGAELLLCGILMMIQPKFDATTVVYPTGKQTGAGAAALGQLGGLASLAGISIPQPDSVVPVAVLQSRDLTRDFIVDNDLLPVIFSDQWDGKKRNWKEGLLSQPPDIRDAVKYFNEKIRFVVEDKKTGLVTVIIRWKDAQIAAKWANEYIASANTRLRNQAIREADQSVKYLAAELDGAAVLSVHQAISKVLEGQLQKAALARATEEFAFRVVDSAVAPKKKSTPQRTAIALVGLLVFTLGFGVYFIFEAELKLIRSEIRDALNRKNVAS